MTNSTALPTTKHYEVLDVLRGIAILLVFFYHGLSYTYGINKFTWDGWHRNLDYSWDFLLLAPVTLGPAGVAIFFVVSGFCIHNSLHSLERRDSDSSRVWLTFAIRRAFRIYPPYLAALFLFTLGDVINGQLGSSDEVIHQLWTHAALVHNYWENTYYGINPSFWSIAVEAQLNLIFPILWVASKRISWPVLLLLLFLIEFLLRSNGYLSGFQFHELVHRSPLTYWFSWALGAYIAHIRQTGLKSCLSRIPLWFPSALLFATWYVKILDPYFFPATALLTAVYLIRRLESQQSTVSQGSAKKYLNQSLSYIGVISYSLYLFHQPLISVWNKILQRILPGEIPSPIHYPLIAGCLIPILIFSAICHRWIEKPGIRWGNSFLQRIVPRRQPTAAITSL